MLTFSPECFCFEQEAPFYGFPSNWKEGCPAQAGAIVILGGKFLTLTNICQGK